MHPHAGTNDTWLGASLQRVWGESSATWQSVWECHPLVQQRQGSRQRGIYDRSMDTSLPIVGRRVAKVSFAYVVPYLTLDLPAWTAEGEPERSDYVLQIDGSLRFTASGIEHEIELEDEADPALLRLLRKTVSRAMAHEDGTLYIDFVDGDVLTVQPSAYEPWQLNGSDGSQVISVAGGGIAVLGLAGDGA